MVESSLDTHGLKSRKGFTQQQQRRFPENCVFHLLFTSVLGVESIALFYSEGAPSIILSLVFLVYKRMVRAEASRPSRR